MTATDTTGEWSRLGSEFAWHQLLEDRSSFQRAFVRLLLESPQLSGKVLDIGCSGNLPEALRGLENRFGSLDGVDPNPAVARHPLLQRHWHGMFECADTPPDNYDLAYSYNVLEHIAEPRPFFEKVFSVLKPGGVFWGLTPNSQHPFAVLSRSIEVAGLKGLFRRQIGHDESGNMRVNDYPAYYRCNSPSSVRRAIRGIGFSQASFYFHPCVQWDTYFPRVLRWAPRFYDFCLGTRWAPGMQILIMKLEK
jgi:SAM-dependent methyltransferase